MNLNLILYLLLLLILVGLFLFSKVRGRKGDNGGGKNTVASDTGIASNDEGDEEKGP